LNTQICDLQVYGGLNVISSDIVFIRLTIPDPAPSPSAIGEQIDVSVARPTSHQPPSAVSTTLKLRK
jgi:hypothetical protein